jgi:tRNA-specific 2-thiouridylase
VATGHYARIGERNGQKTLLRARDPSKDQSYVLFALDRKILDRVMFPVGQLNKTEVRAIAARLNLPNRAKPDSVEICFAPDRDYVRVVRERRPDAFVEGDVVNTGGEVVGRHKGIPHYTIGQRRGLGIAAGKPIYVSQLDTASNTVTVGDDDALLASALVANRLNFLIDRPVGPFRAHVKIRYLHRAAPALIEPIDAHAVRVTFDQPQRAITPGQAVVFYNGDLVLGGGWIHRAGA